VLTQRALIVAAGLLGSAIAAAQQPVAPGPSPNQLTAAEKAAGWKLLFDGKSTDGWRGYKKSGFPDKGWTADGGCLKCEPKGGGGDIITKDQYGDFELSLEWKVSPGANSGVIYRVAEKQDASWQTGPEFQILDDAGNPAIKPINSAGALYDLYEPAAAKVLRPTGEFNQARIRLKDNVLQHFVNGVKVLECRIGDDEWRKRVAGSKFAKYDGFGAQPRGHIALQDHGNAVWFRNIKVRDLSAAMPGEVRLFNGTNMGGWKAILPQGGQMDDVWSVQDGVIVCKGNPVGYIRSEKDFKNYVLKLEWRFNPVTKKAGNSGVLLRMIGEDKVWPRSVEAQLQSGSAGDFWNIDEFPMKTDTSRLNGRNTKKTHMAERPIGEWNEYEIIVDGPRVTLNVNGETLNEAWEVLETPGKICLQSEGAEIHFRNIRLAPIE
jgi:hypothetical protein